MAETPRTDALARIAADNPAGVAYRMLLGGQSVTWAELEQRSRRCAAMLLQRGLKTGDGIAVYMDNHLRYFEILWAAHRVGLYYTTISRHLKTEEMLYIVRDCGARALFTAADLPADAAELAAATPGTARFALDSEAVGFESYEAALQRVDPAVQLPHTPEGADFSYSSGTTGRPKGIKRTLEQANRFFVAAGSSRTAWKEFDGRTVYLSTAPFYHTAPVRWNMNVMRQGGSCVLMEKFDALQALQAIQRHQVTHSQWVTTMFVRLLRLPLEQRRSFDLSSMRYAIHAAAPCPVWVKEQMIEWWGPVLHEYYSGTELVGRTSLDSGEWLVHKGSVGRPEFGAVHIVGESGEELPAGQTGQVYFSGGPSFEYHGDPEKTAQAFNAKGWGTYGDIGHVDADGYLYLTDRLANMIISGGVNIYPQETENVLLEHPAVRDAAVVGVPNEEFGEEVKAVVELWDPALSGPELGAELIAFCRERLSSLKCPRSLDFAQALPRTQTGKLLKREIKARFWPAASAGHVPGTHTNDPS